MAVTPKRWNFEHYESINWATARMVEAVEGKYIEWTNHEAALAVSEHKTLELTSELIAAHKQLAEKDTTLAHAATTIVEIMRLKKAVAEKDAHITTLLDTSAVLNTYQDTLKMLEEKNQVILKQDLELVRLDQKLQDLMHQAVRFAEYAYRYLKNTSDNEHSHVSAYADVCAFLSSKEVQAYQAQQKESG
jgi:vacuolar-type H+-ATPase subunit I/STV1